MRRNILIALLLCCFSFFVESADALVYDYKAVFDELRSGALRENPDSAMAKLDTLIAVAKAEGNVPMQINGLIYQIILLQNKHEFSTIKSIAKIQKELDTASFPVSAILHRMLAQLYTNYLQRSKYQFFRRSQVMDNDEMEAAAWDKTTIKMRIIKEFQLSLNEAERLKQEKISVYLPMLLAESNKHKYLYNSLYDFLAWEAIDYLSSGGNSLPRPVNEFKLDDAAYFSEAESFSMLQISTPDTLSDKYLVCKLFMDLTQHYLDGAKPNTLLYIEILRLEYIYLNSSLPQKDALFEAALKKIIARYPDNELSAFAAFKLAVLYHNQGANYLPGQNEEIRWHFKLAYEICQAAYEKYPDSIGGESCLALKHNIALPSLTFAIEDCNIPNSPVPALFKLRNITAIRVNIYKIPYPDILTQPYNNHFRWLHNGFNASDANSKELRALLQKTPFSSQVYAFENEGDYRIKSYEIPLTKLPAGLYVIMVTEGDKDGRKKQDILSFGIVNSSNIIVNGLNTDKTKLQVLNRDTGHPIKKAKVTLYRWNGDQARHVIISTAKSDASGWVALPIPKDWMSYRLQISTKNDTLQTSYYDMGSPVITRPKVRCMFFTDRAIYRPGQTVQLKGMFYYNDGEISHPINSEGITTVIWEDVNRSLVQRIDNIPTLQNGSFETSLKIPSDRLSGSWSLTANCKFSNGEYGYGYTNIKVEEYKRPTFEVSIQKPVQVYSLQNRVDISGTAMSYSGVAVKNATGQYRVTRIAKYPAWHWWWGVQPDTIDKEILNGTLLTDSEGRFQISFIAEGDIENLPKHNPFYTFKLEASVTDLNGETRSGSFSLDIGEKELNLQADLPEFVDISQGAFSFAISSANLQDEAIPTQGNVNIYLLQHPDNIQKSRIWPAPSRNYLSRSSFLSILPTSIYGTEDNLETWEKGKKLYGGRYDSTARERIEIQNLSEWPTGIYLVEMDTELNGKSYRTAQYFRLYDTQAKAMPFPMAELFAPIKVICEPGEHAHILIGSSYKDVRISYEVEKNHQITYGKILNLNNEQRLLSIPVTEADRGDFYVHLHFVKDGRIYLHSQKITVPWTNKQLKLQLLTFRDKLLPRNSETWSLKIEDNQGNGIPAEVLASMYDASLDAFYTMKWPEVLYGQRVKQHGWKPFNPVMPGYAPRVNLPYFKGFPMRDDYSLDWYHHASPTFRGISLRDSDVTKFADILKNLMEEDGVLSCTSITEHLSGDINQSQPKFDFSSISPRKNFAETAFFYPRIITDSKGEASFSFTVPESLTKWKFRAFAISDSLRTGYLETIAVSQKTLMITSNLPRFLRQGDTIHISAKISALDNQAHEGSGMIMMLDPISGANLDSLFTLQNKAITFSLKSGENTSIEWDLQIPAALNSISIRILAQSDGHTDAEEYTLPILPNRTLVTESLPLPVSGKSTRSFTFEKLKNMKDSTSLISEALSLEYTANPAWFVVQAMPYLLADNHESLDETSRRLYANTMANQILKTKPIFKQIITTWKTQGKTPALLSNLQKNQEWKSISLKESPWLLDALSESEEKWRISLAFDDAKLKKEFRDFISILQVNQFSCGAWPWFPGTEYPSMRTTMEIVENLARMEYYFEEWVDSDIRIQQMLSTAIPYLDSEIQKRYEVLQRYDRLTNDNLDYDIIRYLYLRSYLTRFPLTDITKTAWDYYQTQVQTNWRHTNFYGWGALALATYKFGDTTTAARIMKALKENALYDDELGMYWKDEYGWDWYQSNIQRQAILIEAFSDILEDTKSVDAMKQWLLKHKQTNRWKNHKATIDACFAMLLRGTNWVSEDVPVEIRVGENLLEQKSTAQKPGNSPKTPEAGTGYFKHTWKKEDIHPSLADVSITNPNNTPSWGAMYWQYFEDLDKISAAETPLKLKKQLYVERINERGSILELVSEQSPLKVGDKVVVRIELKCDREMEFLHLKDMRSAGFEPLNVLSGHKIQNGLRYYEATKDVATNFFIEKLPKGTFIFEYSLRVMQKGIFSNGITSIQCLYAPEFSSHSEGIIVRVGE